MGRHAIRLMARRLHNTASAKIVVSAVRLETPVSPIGCVKLLIGISIEADARTSPILLRDVRLSVITVRVLPEISPGSHGTYLTCPGYSLYFPPGVVRTGGAAFLVSECGDFTSKYYCCDEDGSRSCCNDPGKNLGLTVAENSSIASTPSQYVGSPTAAVSQTRQPSGAQGPHSSPTTTIDTGKNASSHSNRHAVVAGAAAGSSIAAVVIVLGIVAYFWLHRRPGEQEKQGDQAHGVERADVNEPNRPAQVLGWEDSSVVDSPRDLPSLNHTQSPTHSAIEVNSPTIRRLTSFTRSPPSPISMSNTEAHRRMPSADQVSAISIGSTYIPYHPPPKTATPFAASNQVPATSVGPSYIPYHPSSRTARPPAVAELESNFDIAPIQVQSRPMQRPPPPAPLELEARDGVTITALWHANTSPDSPHGPTKHGSPLSTMLQGSTTSPELAPKAELPSENAGSAESKTNKAPTIGTPISTVVQSPHPTTERKARHAPTLEALREGSQDLQRAHDKDHTFEEARDRVPSETGGGGGSQDLQGGDDKGHTSGETRQGVRSETEGTIQEVRPTDGKGHTSEEANVPSTSPIIPYSEPKSRQE